MIEICENKLDTRNLYEEAFGDPKEFTDYYYEDKCLDNTIIVSREKGEVISMLHLNPFMMNVCGSIVKTYYVVAVATKEDRRHEGQMSRVFEKAYEIIGKENIPFIFLLPVDLDIYAWMGFEKICDFSVRSNLDYDKIKSDYDVYCIRDELYIRRMEKEIALDEMAEGELLPENPVIMAKVTDIEAFEKMAGQRFDNEKKCLEWLRKKRIYIREEI